MMADQEIKQQFRDALRQALLEANILEADLADINDLLEADIKEWKEWLDQETKEREESMSETKPTLEQPEWRPLTSEELAQAEEEWGPELKAEAERDSHE